MSLRKIWSDAKKQVRVKNWEAQLKLKDDFGPSLDKLESAINDTVAAMLGAERKMGEAERLADLLETTAKSYKKKIQSVEQSQDTDELDPLLDALDTIGRGITQALSIIKDCSRNLKDSAKRLEAKI